MDREFWEGFKHYNMFRLLIPVTNHYLKSPQHGVYSKGGASEILASTNFNLVIQFVGHYYISHKRTFYFLMKVQKLLYLKLDHIILCLI